MTISISLPALAPQPTGHPASLPANPDQPDTAQTVAPAGDSETSNQTDNRQAGSDAQPESAPPSAMQIKIMEMLQAQAEEIEQSEQG